MPWRSADGVAVGISFWMLYAADDNQWSVCAMRTHVNFRTPDRLADR
jgi:hypothetical protein